MVRFSGILTYKKGANHSRLRSSNGILSGIHCWLQPAFHSLWCLMKRDTKLTYRSASNSHKPRFGGVFHFPFRLFAAFATNSTNLSSTHSFAVSYSASLQSHPGNYLKMPKKQVLHTCSRCFVFVG
jgi:hypothetical protein